MWSVYIRICIEVSISVYLNGFIEIYQLNINSANRLISYVFTSVILMVLLTLNAAGFYKWYKILRNEDTSTHFEELFKGLKVNTQAYLYTVLVMTRRMLSIFIVTIGTSLPMYVKLVLFQLIQLCAWGFVVKVRPFTATK